MFSRLLSISAALSPAVFLLVVLIKLPGQAASQVTEARIIISEVAWSGTRHQASDEWVELYNAGDAAVSLTGWTLEDSSGDLAVAMMGEIAPGAFFLLERTDDATVSDVAADQIYQGGLNNSGETLTLRDGSGAVVDTANAAGGAWPAGEGSPLYATMERAAVSSPDSPGGWVSNNGIVTNGFDAGGNPIVGTPRAMNSSWTPTSDDLPDLALSLAAPAQSVAGGQLLLELSVVNSGAAAVTGVVVTMTLPAGLDYVSDDSGVVPEPGAPGVVVWRLGQLPAGQQSSFTIATGVEPSIAGSKAITAQTAGEEDELSYTNNQVQVTVHIIPSGDAVLIGALLYDGYELNDADETVQLVNTAASEVDVSGWLISNGRGEAALPAGTSLEPFASIWVARDAPAFRRQFGFDADVVLSSWPGFANAGDELILLRSDRSEADALVYKAGSASGIGWQGAGLTPYRVSGVFAEEGQILFRLRDEQSGLPLADSDSVLDWAQSTHDPIAGRRVSYPGWSSNTFFEPIAISSARPISIAVAPDNAFEAFKGAIARAQASIFIETLTLEHVAIGEALVAAAKRGVQVNILLEGAPVGGIDDQERFVCQRIEASGGACWFMIRDDAGRIHDRYRYVHAKFMIVDEKLALISSENLSPYSLPDDSKADGTWGRRGLVVMTTEPAIVQRLLDVFHDDLDPAAHQDLLRWQANHTTYGAPPDNFVPITVTGGVTYTVRYPSIVPFQDVNSVALYQAPENLMRRQDGLFALLAAAGYGDMILVQQLSERWHWGATHSEPSLDPNPRLESYIDAARRGATVRILLDAHFDSAADPLSNAATCAYVRQVAAAEHLHLYCALANPTGLGIHNKMVLARVAGKGWVNVGSWNGTEQSAKGNREMALHLQSDAAYTFLAQLFQSDWPHQVWWPLAMNQFRGAAHYPLISEILYDPTGPDDGEFIELNNPTPDPVNLSGWSISDAVAADDFEDARRFPEGTILAPRRAIVVAMSGARFIDMYGFAPDFEIVDSREDVTDMIDDPRWGDPAALLQLGNEGDELLLRRPDGVVVDVVTYGSGFYPGVAGCPLVTTPGEVLERLPYWRDSDDCASDFRVWRFPSPGRLP